MVPRPLYLEQIKPYINQPFIKILVGLRRAGKSTILEQVKALLITDYAVPEDQLVHINFDSLEYATIRDKADFLPLITDLYQHQNKRYFLLDEIQNIANWDEVISALFNKGDVDIYLTGSNSKLLSSELSTFLTGRFINIPVSTLNFREFLDFESARGNNIGDIPSAFDKFLTIGGFPALHLADQTPATSDEIVSDIYSSILFRDLIERKNIRNTELLARVVKYIADNIGNIFSAKSISDYLKNEHRTLSVETIYNYLTWLEEAFIIRRVQRYDLRGKTILKTNEKFFLGDISILYALNGRSPSYLTGALENLVYNELVSRGYQVYIGQNNDAEVDFIAEKNHEKLYLQVTAHLSEKSTADREFNAYLGIDDNYPKYVLSLDQESAWSENRAGIKQKYLPDFILNEL